ncbi:integrator complex subunit 7-like [Melopsittacus undulatus]|uniref:integrator complex subunit 7-like n=1 Tax=Melopsittacus undulatus TaxID=13146 RepID=UPI001469DA57|nr:integrator complex subunit 7-like [Melopsittacus undulatus]
MRRYPIRAEAVGMAASAKSFLSDAGYGEQELDANSALMEVDKGLRYGKLGEQCEAVVRFPRLFKKYPFPNPNPLLRRAEEGARERHPGQRETLWAQGEVS